MVYSYDPLYGQYVGKNDLRCSYIIPHIGLKYITNSGYCHNPIENICYTKQHSQTPLKGTFLDE